MQAYLQMRREYQSVKGEDATRGFACRFTIISQRRGVAIWVWGGRVHESSAELVPLWRIFGGTLNRPRHFPPRQIRSPPPRSWLSTCNNVYNAESCSTGIASVHRCSTGFGGRQSVSHLLVGGCNTTSGGSPDPRVRVGEFFCESGSGFPDISPDIYTDTFSDIISLPSPK